MKLTHFVYQGTTWPYPAWHACCFLYERGLSHTLDTALYNYACKHGIVWG